MISDLSFLLPLIFATLMGIAILVYVILDGFDLGIGILFCLGNEQEKDVMVSAIGPFWDANETWLVLAVGLLLVAFPFAHGEILTALYIPVFILLVGLILRGVAFDFRTKAKDDHKKTWNFLFFTGSLLASLAQGYMLGIYVLGLRFTWETILFALLVSFCLAASYIAMGAAWLIYKTEGKLQKKSVLWFRSSLIWTAAGMACISFVTPIASSRIFNKWFSFPDILFLSPLPLLSLFLFGFLWKQSFLMPKPNDRHSLLPFLCLSSIFFLGFLGLAWSFYPFVIPDKMTIWEASASTESLTIILLGALFVLPMVLFYSFYSYRVFSGKASDLSYD